MDENPITAEFFMRFSADGSVVTWPVPESRAQAYENGVPVTRGHYRVEGPELVLLAPDYAVTTRTPIKIEADTFVMQTEDGHQMTYTRAGEIEEATR